MNTARCVSVYAMLALALVVAGCDDGSGGTAHQDSIDIPMGIGMYWVYEVYDNLTATADTIEVSIVDTLHGSDGQFAYLQHSLSSKGEVERLLFAPGGDTLAVYSASVDPPTLIDRVIFPLKPGRTWTGPFASLCDTAWVVDSEVVMVPAGGGLCSRVERRYDHDSDDGYDSVVTWFNQTPGLVKRHMLGFQQPDAAPVIARSEVRKLRDFDLTTFPRRSFPDAPGTWWRYATYDSLGETADTITVTVRGQVPPESRDIPITVWEIRSDGSDSSIVDSLFVADEGRWMSIREDTLPSPGVLQDAIEFPLAVGRNWGLCFIIPVPEVVEKASITVPAGQFESAFRSITPSLELNEYRFAETWLVPHVGIVKRHFRHTGFGPLVNTTWELLDFSESADRSPTAPKQMTSF